MIRFNPYGDYPDIDDTAYVDPLAVVIGKVRVGKDVFVAPGAVIRADEKGSAVTIGDRSNIQDRVMIHALGKSSVVIGNNTSLSHGCVVHGPCEIGDGCFVGFGSVIFKSVVEDGVFIKNLAVIEGVSITSNKFITSGSIVDSPNAATSLPSASKKDAAFADRVISANLRLVKGYRKIENQVLPSVPDVHGRDRSS